MASGKSSIGRRVAALLNIPFVDTDSLIAAQHGAIADFFALHGEQEFRSVEEATVLAELQNPEPRVIALGGGAVLSAKTREALRSKNTVLLMTDADTVLNRANIEKRPLLKDDPQAWTRILNERLPLYEDVASVTFDTSKLPKDTIAQRIVDWYQGQRAS